MQDLWKESKWCSAPTAYWTVQYEYKRDGKDMKYRFYWKVWLGSSSGWYNNGLKLKLFIDDVEKGITVKGYVSDNKGWSYSGYAPSSTEWYTVSNKTSGTVPFYAQIYDTSTNTTEKTSDKYQLTVSGAASVLGAISDFNIGTAIPIKITKYNSSFTDSLEVKYGDIILKSISPIANGAAVNLTESEWDNFYKNNKKSNQGKIVFKLTTKDGSTTIGTSEQEATATIINANPIFTDDQISYRDSNYGVVAITKKPEMIVQGKSILEVTREDAIGQKYADISEYSYVINGVTCSTSAEKTVTIGSINTKQDFVLEITAKDNRGNTTTAKKTITVSPYIEPVIAPHSNYGTITCERCDAEGNIDKRGSFLRVMVKGQWYTLLNGENAASVDIKYMCTGFESDWIPISSSETIQGGGAENNYIAWYDINKVIEDVTIDPHKTYKVIIRCIDSFQSAPDIPFKISTQDTCLHLGKYGNKAAFGKYAEIENALEVATEWDLILKGNAVNDFIIDSGTSGIWTYRKWNSGIAECWCTTNQTEYAVTTSYGSGYFGEADDVKWVNGLFGEPPVVSCFFETNNWGVPIVSCDGITDEGMSLRLYSAASYTYNGKFHIKAIGKCKELEEE